MILHVIYGMTPKTWPLRGDYWVLPTRNHAFTKSMERGWAEPSRVAHGLGSGKARMLLGYLWERDTCLQWPLSKVGPQTQMPAGARQEKGVTWSGFRGMGWGVGTGPQWRHHF